MYRDIPHDLLEAVEPTVVDHDCELVDLEVTTGSTRGGTSVVRLTIDTKEGDGRVPIDVCARVSREVGAQLDARGTIAGAYNLEVSSPGLDRLLAREKDFAAACGKTIKLKTRRPVGGRRRFKGRLVAFRQPEGVDELEGEAVVVLNVDDQDHEIPFAEVEKANSIYQFSREDFSSKNEKSSRATG